MHARLYTKNAKQDGSGYLKIKICFFSWSYIKENQDILKVKG